MNEVKFQNKTRGGYEYRIYTREGMSKRFPIVGEVDTGDMTNLANWTPDGQFHENNEHLYDLIPIEPAELEGLVEGDLIWSIAFDGDSVWWEIITIIDKQFKISDDVWVRDDGSLSHIGNGQQLFFRSEERALASINKGEENA